MLISGQKYTEIGIELGLAKVLDNFSYYFVFSIKNEGVIEVFGKLTLKTSRDRKCFTCGSMLCHAVRIHLKIIVILT